MSFPGNLHQIPVSFKPPEDAILQPPVGGADPMVPLLNLSTVQVRMDSLQRFLSDSVNNNTLIGRDQMDMVSTEIASAIKQIIVNGAALLACSQSSNISAQSEESTQKSKPINNRMSSILKSSTDSILSELESNLKINISVSGTKISTTTVNVIDPKAETMEVDNSEDWEIIELDAVELLAENTHFCDICGKGFKRDANLRMHMRAHGNKFKTPEALAKPEKCVEIRQRVRFSCPYVSCKRNKLHKKFMPLKSAICVKNHFKRSHCPKMYSCNRCNKKSFSVVADLKSHMKHCGETKWKCSCGTSFSRKDKLFGHMALFEGHMPAVEEDEKAKGVAAMADDEDEDEEDPLVKKIKLGTNYNAFFDEFLEGFGSIENFCLDDVLDSPNATTGLGTGMDGTRKF